MMNLIKNQLKSTGPYLSFIGLLGGIIADILQPLAPLSNYLFYFSTFIFIVLLIFVLIKKNIREKLVKFLILIFSLSFFSGLLYAFQDEQSKSSGFLSSNIEFIEDIQRSIGILSKDISSIKDTTENIEEIVERIETENTKTNEVIISSLSEIQSQFSSLNQSDGIIDQPSTPEEFYHNARLFELKGDYINARQSYNNYFQFKLDFVDPHLRYQTFLKVQEGRAGALEIYNSILMNDKRPIVEFAKILLFPSETRIKLLENFIKDNETFAPAYYKLSNEYSESMLGIQSRSDKENELKYLEKFMTLNKEGKFLKFFIDNELASSWINDTETRLASLKFLSDSQMSSRVFMSAMPSNQGWMITLSLMESAREIFYSYDSEEDFKSTGTINYVDPQTGQMMPNYMLNDIPLGVKNRKIYVKYLDINNVMQGPYEIIFDSQKAFLMDAKQMIKTFSNDWGLGFDNRANYYSLYVTGLLSHRCGLREVKIGIGKEIPDTIVDLGECDEKNPNAIPSDLKTSYKLSADIDFASIQIIFADGEKTEVKKVINYNYPPTR